jgi:hypothetical protein
MTLIKYPHEFIHFTNQQWNKIKASEEKHKNDSMEYEKVKEHFIDEIIECFNLVGTTHGYMIKKMLMQKWIDEKELIDVANMAFAMTLTDGSKYYDKYTKPFISTN